jgi:hypothetical protein
MQQAHFESPAPRTERQVTAWVSGPRGDGTIRAPVGIPREFAPVIEQRLAVIDNRDILAVERMECQRFVGL